MFGILAGAGDRSGTFDRSHGTMYTEPWAWRNSDAVYVGWNGQVWLYRSLPVVPLKWEDPTGRLSAAAPLHSLLLDLGSTSRDPGGGLRMLTRERELHLLAVTSLERPSPPDGVPALLADYQRDALPRFMPRRRLLVGVRLWSSRSGQQAGGRGLVGQLRTMARGMTSDVIRGLGEHVPDLGPFNADRDDMHARLQRAGGTVPDRAALAQLESWYNKGRGTAEVMLDTERQLELPDGDRIEMAAVQRFDDEILVSPRSMWVMDALSHASPASVVSVRCHLQPPSVAINRLRSSERRLIKTIQEESETGDLSRPEDSKTLQMARQVESFLSDTPQPVLTRCSILFARRETAAEPSTYIETLRDTYGVQVKPVLMRQLEALTETLPTSSMRVNPFVQDLLPAFVSYSGIHAGASLGDERGLFGGLVDPEYAPFYLDVTGAGEKDLPAATAVVGDSGSGKAQPLYARVLTPSGWRAMGDLRVGDEVVGRDGAAHRIDGVHERGVRRVWTVKVEDGSTVDCCDEHLWTVDVDGGRRRTVDTATLAGMVAAGGPVRLPTLSPPAHPPSAVDPVRAARSLLDGQLEGVSAARRLSVAEVGQRRRFVAAVLAGAARTDRGALRVGLPSAAAAGAVADCVRSLGGMAWREGATLTCQGAPGQPLSSTHPESPSLAPHRGRRVVEVSSSGHHTPMRCLTVDAIDHLYVTDGWVPTHNTWMCQSISAQAALAGHPVVFINPKGIGSLSPLVDLLDSKGVAARRVRMTDLEEAGGFFDPCRYAPTPNMAAEVAAGHILSVLHGLSESQELDLEEGLREGIASHGARCVGDALEYVSDDEVRERVRKQMRTSSLFSLGAGERPLPRFEAQSGLTLIEFDRNLELPETGVEATTRTQRIHLAALRIVTRAALEILATSGGGVLVVDEAWTFLGHPQGLQALQQLGRMGRSQGLLPIFATQRIADLRGADLESYLSRKFVLRLTEKREASAALEMLGLAPSASRMDWLAQAGSKRPDDGGGPGRPAMALHQDLDGRVGAVMLGPTPPDAARAFSTTLSDRRGREDADPDAVLAGDAWQGRAGGGRDTADPAAADAGEGGSAVATPDAGPAPLPLAAGNDAGGARRHAATGAGGTAAPWSAQAPAEGGPAVGDEAGSGGGLAGAPAAGAAADLFRAATPAVPSGVPPQAPQPAADGPLQSPAAPTEQVTHQGGPSAPGARADVGAPATDDRADDTDEQLEPAPTTDDRADDTGPQEPAPTTDDRADDTGPQEPAPSTDDRAGDTGPQEPAPTTEDPGGDAPSATPDGGGTEGTDDADGGARQPGSSPGTVDGWSAPASGSRRRRRHSTRRLARASRGWLGAGGGDSPA